MKKIHKTISLLLSILIIISCLIIPINSNTIMVRADSNGVEVFVASLYADCLGRNPDPVGLNDWCTKLESGQITGKQAAYGFFFSPEFQNHNTITLSEFVDVFYRVFLNRPSDPAGKAYWVSKIGYDMDFAYCTGILFQGFADSVEFNQKCQSYGITSGQGQYISLSGANYGPTTPSNSAETLAQRTNGMEASSVEELDAYWISQGYEIYYIPIGEGYQDENHCYITTSTQKCYAQFYDMTEHYNLINAWRKTQAQNGGLPDLTVISDPNDPRFQYCRQRAVEVAYWFSHRRPIEGPRMIENYTYYPDPRFPENGSENICGGTTDTVRAFELLRDSYLHACAMRTRYTGEMVCAACKVYFVNPDGLSVTSTSPYPTPYNRSTNSGRGFGSATVQLFYGEDYCDWWRHPELGWVEYQQNCYTFRDANGNLIGV